MMLERGPPQEAPRAEENTVPLVRSSRGGGRGWSVEHTEVQDAVRGERYEDMVPSSWTRDRRESASLPRSRPSVAQDLTMVSFLLSSSRCEREECQQADIYQQQPNICEVPRTRGGASEGGAGEISEV